jgi:hypothetical protein
MFPRPAFTPYLLQFESETDCKEFSKKFIEFGFREDCCHENKVINVEFWYPSTMRGPIFEFEEEGDYRLRFHCIFNVEPPDWFMERVCEFPGFDFSE